MDPLWKNVIYKVYVLCSVIYTQYDYRLIDNFEVELYNVFVTWVGEVFDVYNTQTELSNVER